MHVLVTTQQHRGHRKHTIVKECVLPVLRAGEAVEAAATGGIGLTGGVVSIPLSSIIFSALRTLKLRFRLKNMKSDDCMTAGLIHRQVSIIRQLQVHDKNVKRPIFGHWSVQMKLWQHQYIRFGKM